MSFNQATLEQTENIATVLRERLKGSPVHLIAFNEIIKGCRTLKDEASPEIAVELAKKFSPYQKMAHELHAHGDFDEQAHDALKLYETILKELAQDNHP